MVVTLNFTSGVDAPRKKISFFSPHPLQDFSKWTRMRSWVKAAS